MLKLIRRDSMLLGFIIGAILPLIVYVIIYYINKNTGEVLKNTTLQLISIVLNVFVFRHYLIKERFELTGRGVLISTFVYALITFYMIFD